MTLSDGGHGATECLGSNPTTPLHRPSVPQCQRAAATRLVRQARVEHLAEHRLDRASRRRVGVHVLDDERGEEAAGDESRPPRRHADVRACSG